MRCHLATAVTIAPTETHPTPLHVFMRTLTRPLSDGLSLGEHLIAGAVASGTAVALMHPMDTIKTVVQAHRTTITNPSTVSTSPTTLSALSTTLRTGGLSSLYKGLGISLSGQVPAGAIKFAAFETFTQLANNLFPHSSKSAPIDFACGALAFIACSVVLVPSELLKQRLQSGAYTGVRSAVTNLVKKQGIKGLYTGYNATLFRDVPYTMLEFGLYSQLKKVVKKVIKKDELTAQQQLIVGGMAGGCTGFFTTPLDLVKTRIMTQSTNTNGIINTLTNVAKEEGLGGLFKGSAARVVWLVPFTAIFFGVHEMTKRKMMRRKMFATARKEKQQ